MSGFPEFKYINWVVRMYRTCIHLSNHIHVDRIDSPVSRNPIAMLVMDRHIQSITSDTVKGAAPIATK